MLQILLNGIIVGSIYAIITIGFNLIYSAVRFYHLAFGAVGIFGAYITFYIQKATLKTFSGSYLFSFIFATICATIIGGLIGVLVWKLLYKPLRDRGASDVSMIVASFGLLIVFQNLAALLFNNRAATINITQKVSRGYQFLGLSITPNQLAIITITLLSIIGFELLLQKTKIGSAIRAVGQNKDLSALVGINTERVIMITFFIATALSVLAISAIAVETSLKPQLGLVLILKAIVASVIGGIGTIRGALAGGLILGIAENFGAYFLGGRWQDVVAFSLLIIFILFLPQGLFKQTI